MADATVTAKQLAQKVGTDAKTLRRFLRSYLRDLDQETPGQGGRYAFTKAEAKTLAHAFREAHKPKPKMEPVADEELDDEEFELTDEDIEGDDDDEETEDDEDESEDNEPAEQEEDLVADELEEIDVETL